MNKNDEVVHKKNACSMRHRDCSHENSRGLMEVNPFNVVIQDERYHLVTLFTLFTLWNRLVKYWNLASGKRLQFAIASMAIEVSSLIFPAK